jgi:hypothetical protein
MTAVEWERRWARPVAIAAILAAFLFLAGVILQTIGVDRADDATQLASSHHHLAASLAGAVLLALGSALFAVPLYYLIRAARHRDDSIHPALVAFAFIGPLLLAVSTIMLWAATDDVAKTFLAGTDHTADTAKRLLDDSSLANAARGLGVAAALGLVAGMVYISLKAMRVGLLTRFWGTLGMALGVGSALLGLVAFVGLAFWFAYVGFLIGGWLKTGRPPAWEAGVAIPWPQPEPRGGRKPPAGVVEGDGTEIDVGPQPDGTEIDVGPDPGLDPAAAETPADDSAESQDQRRKPRKRRE